MALHHISWLTKRVWAVIALGFVSVAHAQCPPPPTMPSPEQAAQFARQADNKGFLFRVSKQGLSSWVYGTIHVGDTPSLFPGAGLQTVLSQSKAIALEINMTDILGLMGALKRAYDSPANRQMQTASRLKMIEQQAKRNCTDLNSLQNMPIVLQAMTVAINESQYDGIYADFGQEAVLLEYARKLSKTIHGLETLQEQLELLMSPDIAEELDDMLSEQEMKDSRTMLVTLMKVWKERRYDTLETYLDWCNCYNTVQEKRMLDQMILQRNSTMVKRAIDLHEQYKGGVLFAVGSLHLIGETGFVNAFKQAGYSVERMY